MVKTILIVGVGGQGSLLASRLLGNVLLRQGFDVKVNEVHGMSQRGGSVVTVVRFGEKVYSPVAEKGSADYILSFESLEAARWLPYLKEGGVIISNTQKIDPMPVIVGAAKYPENIGEKIYELGADIVEVNALDLAVKAGNKRAVNVVLLGVLARRAPFGKEVWIDAIRETVPERFLEVNLMAFELGYSYSV